MSEGLIYYSRVPDPESFDLGPTMRTPNKQVITDIRADGRRMLVYTRSRVYYYNGSGRKRLRLYRVR